MNQAAEFFVMAFEVMEAFPPIILLRQQQWVSEAVNDPPWVPIWRSSRNRDSDVKDWV